MNKYHIQIKANSRAQGVVFDSENDVYLVSVKSTPVEGRANAELLTVFASYLDVPKSLLSLEKGITSRYKTILLNK